jgi:tight adherence protein B
VGFLYSNDFFLISLIAVAVFFVSYFQSNRLLAYIQRRTEGTRREVLDLIDSMLLDVDKKKITIATYLLSIGLGFSAFLAVWPNIIPGLILGIFLTTLGWRLPQLFLKNLWEKRCNQVVEQMVDGLTIMSNGIKAGLSLTQTMERVSANISGPLPDELNLVLSKIRLGMTVEDALIEFGERIPRPDVQMLVTSINILKETGGNLGETFETIVTVVRERQKVEKKIQAMTAQGLMQGMIVSAVPFVLLLVFAVSDPTYIEPLFTKSLGWIALGVILTLQIIGGIMIKNVVTIKV